MSPTVEMPEVVTCELPDRYIAWVELEFEAIPQSKFTIDEPVISTALSSV